MAHFAELDNNNIVVRVLVTDNNDPNGDEGYKFLLDTFGGTWIQTSYNGNIRYNYASIGYTYDAEADAFIAPRPECGHKELFLNDKFRWNCQGCNLERKKLSDEA
jgi:hypothetical protein